jgi:hypothetical protein
VLPGLLTRLCRLPFSGGFLLPDLTMRPEVGAVF